jgi:NhaP-type Na+/H+ and K+/H+ antiporter
VVLLAFIVPLKALPIAGLLRFLGASDGTAIRSALWLGQAGVLLPKMFRRVRMVREDRFQLLQGYFERAADLHADVIEHGAVMLLSVELPEDSGWKGCESQQAIGERVRLMGLLREGQRLPAAQAGPLKACDLLILTGRNKDFGQGETRLLEGPLV